MTAAITLPRRPAVLAVAAVSALGAIALLTAVLAGSHAAVILLDYHAVPPLGYPFVFPFTVQNLMHLFLAAGLAEVWLRWRVGRREAGFLGEGLLPEDDETVLQSHDLPAIRRGVVGRSDGKHGFLPGLIDLCILQFQASRSVDQTVSVLNSALELLSDRVELRYSLLRYTVWVIPTIGFIGTVVGISLALTQLDATDPDLTRVTASLGTAFYTTLVALVESAFLVLLLHLVESQEEQAVNDAGRYVLVNLINRLFSGGASPAED
jgi:hypothetical protein